MVIIRKTNHHQGCCVWSVLDVHACCVDLERLQIKSFRVNKVLINRAIENVYLIVECET